jgi:hypothetical protein
MALSDADVQKQVNKKTFLCIIYETSALLYQKPSLIFCSKRLDYTLRNRIQTIHKKDFNNMYDIFFW